MGTEGLASKSFFFACNHLDYALDILKNMAQMCDQKQTNPDVWREFEAGDFRVSTSHFRSHL